MSSGFKAWTGGTVLILRMLDVDEKSRSIDTYYINTSFTGAYRSVLECTLKQQLNSIPNFDIYFAFNGDKDSKTIELHMGREQAWKLLSQLACGVEKFVFRGASLI
jgi:hypothetical protein